MKFLRSKTMVILSIVVITGLIAVGLLGIQIINNNKKVIVPNFEDYDEQEVLKWCNSFSENPCLIKYEFSETVDEGKVIYQSISENEEIEDTINITISNGKKPIEMLKYNGSTTKQDVEEWALENNLKKVQYFEEESLDIEKGCVVAIDCDNIIYSDSIIKVYISRGYTGEIEINENGEIIIKKEQFVGKTLSEFEAIVKQVGLVPVHNENKDEKSSSVVVGSIVFNGYGTYTKGENISYGLCTGISTMIEVKAGQYIDLSYKEFVAKCEELKLKINYRVEWEDYSDAIEFNHIIKHGSGSYNEGESISVAISLGKEADKDKVHIKEEEFAGLTVSEIEAKAKELGLVINHKSEWDSYSNSLAKDKVIKHGYGVYEENETFNYGLSLGSQDGSPITITIKEGEYIGYTEADFISKAKALGLNPNHKEAWDAYSETIEKGKIVRNGYGVYEENETFNYGLSLGKKDEDETSEIIEIKQNEFVGLTVAEFENKVKALGLVPKYNSAWDVYSDSVDNGKIVRHGYTTYTKGEEIRYGLSLGKEEDKDKIVISQGQFIGYTEADIISKANSLGLKPNHKEAWDAYSDTVEKGKVVKNGYGTYEKGETFNYGLSLGKQDSSSDDKITIKSGQYVGYTLANFETAIKALGLNIKHLESYDAYSDSVAEGSIVWNGSGTYEKGESVSYGLSKGKDTSTTLITVTSYAGKVESTLTSFLSSNGLNGNQTTAYSNSVTKGYIISNDTGTSYKAGDTINYVVSLGKQIYLPSLDDIASGNEKQSYNDTVNSLKTYMANLGFTNVSYTGTSSTKSVGVILSVSVDGTNVTSAGNYPSDAKIVFTICNAQLN